MPGAHQHAAAGGFFYAVGKAMRLQRGTLGALVLTGSLANTSFAGLPMIGARYGRDHIGLGIPLSFATLPAWWWLLQRLA